MDNHFTLLLLSQHYPISQQFQIISNEDVSIDANIAGFLQAIEQRASQHVLDHIYTHASAVAQ